MVAGPTASGKTDVAIDLALKFNGEIVSADSIQVYRHMDVGSAKPTSEQLAAAPHHMIDVRNPDEEFTCGDYVREARQCIADIVARGRTPIVVGGTGLYIRALLGGIIELPAPDPAIREKLRREEEREGSGALYKRLAQVDPLSHDRIEPENLVRIMRALEVYESTGNRLSELQEKHGFGDRPFDYVFLCLSPGRDVLYDRIAKRVDTMIQIGLLKEVCNLYQKGYSGDLKPLQSLGYRHAGMIIAGRMESHEAIELMKRDTRRYAKRQLTWFRSEPGVIWIDPEDRERIEFEVANLLGL